jgi:hypothetical protein
MIWYVRVGITARLVVDFVMFKSMTDVEQVEFIALVTVE